jgi:hypothetical protein
MAGSIPRKHPRVKSRLLDSIADQLRSSRGGVDLGTAA